MAEKKALCIILLCGLFCLFFAQHTGAAGTIDVELQQTLTSISTVYMEGHEGDPNWISGFSFDSNISIGPVPLGTMSAPYLAAAPPMDLQTLFEDFNFDGVMSLSGYGTCTLTGCGTSMFTGYQGNILIGFSGKMDNCTDSLAGIAGISYGTASADIFSATGESTFTVRVPKP